MSEQPTPRIRERIIGGPDSFVCAGARRTANYSERTPVHWHVWLMVGRFGFAWERPRWNR